MRDVATLLLVSPETVRRWLRTGALEGTFFGGRVGYRIRRASLERFLRRAKSRGRPPVRTRPDLTMRV